MYSDVIAVCMTLIFLIYFLMGWLRSPQMSLWLSYWGVTLHKNPKRYKTSSGTS